MEIAWGRVWNASKEKLKAGWLITSAVVALYIGVVESMNRYREIAIQRQTGLGAVGFEPLSMWHQAHPVHEMLYKARETVAGEGGFGTTHGFNYVASSVTDALPAPPPPSAGISEDRKT